MDDQSAPLSPVPSLSPEMLTIYNRLNDAEKLLFKRVFRWLWPRLHSYRGFTGASGGLCYWWAVDLTRLKYNLLMPDISLLSFLWYITRGKKYIHSDFIAHSPGLVSHPDRMKQICKLANLGYIDRRRVHPITRMDAGPHSRPYLCLSPAGVALIHDIERDIFHLLTRSALSDLTGIKKPGRGCRG